MAKCIKCGEWGANLFIDPVGEISSLCSECFEKETSPNNMITAQEWLNNKYPNKEKVAIVVNSKSTILEGNLVISDYLNLERIDLNGCQNLDLQVKSCPKLEALHIINSEIKNIFSFDCPELKELLMFKNKITGLDLSSLSNLEEIFFRDNSMKEELDISNNFQLKKIEVWGERENYTEITIGKLIEKIQTKEKDKLNSIKELLGKAREEVIIYKLKGKERKLENFIQKLGIIREKVRDLCKSYQKLIRAQESFDPNVFMLMEDEIEKIKDELLIGGWFTWKISLEDTQKLCRKCESIAKLKVEQDKLYQERFEARQEVVLYDKNN